MKYEDLRSTMATALSIAMLGIVATPAAGEAVFDGTMGPGGTLSGNFDIPDSFGTQVGPNLFHSFSIFNVNPGESATFTSSFAGATDNVIARVTGGSLTTIDGLLANSIAGADLWLVNPAGVLFGDNASLSLDGALHASTADYLLLQDGGRFDVSNPGNTMLSMADPVAFGFLEGQPAPLTVTASNLDVPENSSLSLIGGDVSIAGTIVGAPDSRVNIAAVGGAGEISLDADGIGIGNTDSFGSIDFTSATLRTTSDSAGDVFIRGGQFVMQDSFFEIATLGNAATDTGGDVVVDADDVQLLRSQITTTTFGAADAGDIVIRASGDVLLQNNFDIFLGGFFANTRDVATGDGGNVFLSAANLNIFEGAAIGALSFGSGAGGDISVDVTNDIFMRGTPEMFDASMLATATASGNGGSINIDSGSLTMELGALIEADAVDGSGGNLNVATGSLTVSGASQLSVSSGGVGPAGSMFIEAGDVSISGFQFLPSTGSFFVSGLFANNFGTGAGGSINLDFGNLALADFAVINAFVNFGATGSGGILSVDAENIVIRNGAFMSAGTAGDGPGGNVDVNATESLLIDGQFLQFPNFTGIFANTFGNGNAGTITVDTPELSLLNGGSISAGSVSFFSAAIGNGSDVILNVDNLSIDAGFIQAQTFTNGNAGTITVNATGTVTLQNSTGFIFAEGNLPTGGLLVTSGTFLDPTTSGNAGDVTINADALVILDGGGIATETLNTGAGGDITINARLMDMSSADNEFTGISSSTAFGGGDAGTIDINVEELVISDLASIASVTFGDGNAGSIEIGAVDVSVVDGGSITTLSNGAGDAGAININASGVFTATRNDLSRFGNVSSTTSASGSGGTLNIVADEVVLQDGGELSAATSGAGAGGDVRVEGRVITIIDGARIAANSNGDGNAGTIIVVAVDDLLVQGASVETSSELSAGGNINLNVGDTLFLNEEALISAAASGVTPDDGGGNVIIDPFFVVMRESAILATANAGNGGNISIEAGSFIIDSASVIDASSQTGLDGQVSIDAINNVFGSVVLLEAPSIDVSELLTEKCVAEAFRDRSSFTVDRGTVSSWSPEDLLASPYSNDAAAPATQAIQALSRAGECRLTLLIKDSDHAG